MAINAVFFDKDGTLVEGDPDHPDPTRFRLFQGTLDAVSALATEGFKIFVVTNQPGIAYGKYSEEALREADQILRRKLGEAGVEVAGFYFCPHHPAGKVGEFSVKCMCRKPRPGLIDRAALEHGVDCSRSWMVGDLLDDVEAGHRAGCRSVLLDSGAEIEWKISSLRRPEWVVYTIEQAAQLIIREKNRQRGVLGLGEAAGL